MMSVKLDNIPYPRISLLFTDNFHLSKCNTMGVTNGSGAAYPTGATFVYFWALVVGVHL